MKLSYNWLKEYVHIEESPEEISVILTDGGLEVEGMEKIESIKGGLQGLVIGEVKSCSKHPNADRLSVTTVDVGEESLLPIVCGAPNVEAGQKVVVATVGTELHSGEESFTIKKSKIRGEISEGMICAEDEIGIGNSHDGIMVLPHETQVGMAAADYFNVESDYVFEIGLTPNRADATSHIGSARDLVSLLNYHKSKNLKLQIPSVDKFEVDNTNLPIQVEVKSSQDCPRYSGLTINNLKIQESPDWIKNRLNAIGIRPINNVVDITNYVLMETGQPLHAFDYDKIKTKSVVVQKLADGTVFTSLDEVDRKLSSNDLMICDGDSPMCMGGIFGGQESGVSETTKSIFLESAYFNPVTIRKSSKYHTLNTDASFRFERGADPNITIYALKRAALLLKEYAQAEISSEIIDIYPNKIAHWRVNLSVDKVAKVAGISIPKESIVQILKDIDIQLIEDNGNSLVFEVPSNKVDVLREIDLIEEVLRIYGFNSIPIGHSLKSSISYRTKPDNEELVNLVSDFLVSKGYFEAMNNSLSKSDYYHDFGYSTDHSIHMLNPLSSELNALRQHLVFGMLESVRRNLNHKNKNIKLYEFGKHYITKDSANIDVSKVNEEIHLSIIACGDETEENWKYQPQAMDIYSMKAVLYSLLSRVGIKLAQFKLEEKSDGELFHQSLIIKHRSGKVLAELGTLNPKLLKTMEVESKVIYLDVNWDFLLKLSGETKIEIKEIAKYPEVRRDLALLVNKSTSFLEIESLVYKTGGKLIKSCNLFDVYEGKGIEEGKKSYAISCTLQDPDKTLTDKIIDKTMNKIQFMLEKNLGAQLR
jgi:phenylalanyl-tRNA synthetase beta chain